MNTPLPAVVNTRDANPRDRTLDSSNKELPINNLEGGNTPPRCASGWDVEQTDDFRPQLARYLRNTTFMDLRTRRTEGAWASSVRPNMKLNIRKPRALRTRTRTKDQIDFFLLSVMNTLSLPPNAAVHRLRVIGAAFATAKGVTSSAVRCNGLLGAIPYSRLK
jgi:hypothetical protein